MVTPSVVAENIIQNNIPQRLPWCQHPQATQAQNKSILPSQNVQRYIISSMNIEAIVVSRHFEPLILALVF